MTSTTPWEADYTVEPLTVVTREEQVTMPTETRRVLGLKKGDKVASVRDRGHGCRMRRGSAVERTAGALESSRPVETAEEMREQAERAVAEDVVERTQRIGAERRLSDGYR